MSPVIDPTSADEIEAMASEPPFLESGWRDLNSAISASRTLTGAGDRNRTGVMTLEGSGSASELRPRGPDISAAPGRGRPLNRGRDPVEDVGLKIVQRGRWCTLQCVAYEVAHGVHEAEIDRIG